MRGNFLVAGAVLVLAACGGEKKAEAPAAATPEAATPAPTPAADAPAMARITPRTGGIGRRTVASESTGTMTRPEPVAVSTLT